MHFLIYVGAGIVPTLAPSPSGKAQGFDPCTTLVQIQQGLLNRTDGCECKPTGWWYLIP